MLLLFVEPELLTNSYLTTFPFPLQLSSLPGLLCFREISECYSTRTSGSAFQK
uniref:Uncharacterized protein n=1 Tax=Utricularia reniformis TaxID=192314 RepID=A0A1Y0B4U1_9LAMI|nr:hypothetical protein AEK19_MT2287 [Utricularia reniformis]ART32432.1 hypothetical protein AEK19_MT2287 [Utricularia reniformis]